MGGALVLTYHRLTPSSPPDPLRRGGTVALASFERQMQWLARDFDVIGLGELVDRIAQGRPIDGCAAMTFDDGYADTLESALPVVKRYGFPATIFLTTDWIESSRPMWTERLAMRVESPARYYELQRKLAALPARDRDRMLDELGAPQASEPLSLSWEQVRTLADAGFEIGAHSASHASLTNVSDAQLHDEIERSAESIRTHLGARPTLFAYPFGHAAARAAAAIERAGFRAAAGIAEALCRSDSDLMCLPRLDVGGSSAAHLARRVHRLMHPRSLHARVHRLVDRLRR